MNTSITLNNGQTFPLLGLGTWKSDKGKVGAAVKFALLEAGYRHIDCASIYGNEVEIGEAFHDVFHSGKVKRKDAFITSKLWNTDHHPDNVEKACRETLKNLQLEYLDLYLIHWGVAFKHSDEKEPIRDGRVVTEPVSIRETWEAMEKLVKKGLVKSIGVANFTTTMLIDILTYAKVKPVTNQIEVHPYNSQAGLIDFCRHHDIVVTAYSPLGTPGGLRTGDPTLLDDPALPPIAKAHQKTVAQILLRWAVQRETVAIPKSTSVERLQENKAIFDFELTAAEMEKIDALNRNYRFVNPLKWGIPYFG